MGINLQLDAAPVEIQKLAALAQAGEKRAQLDLGIAFEQGAGVPVNVHNAKHLYAQAAADSGGTIWVYQSPIGSAAGRVVPIDLGVRLLGLAEARRRLLILNRGRARSIYNPRATKK